MRKLALATVLVLVASLALSFAGGGKGKTHEMTATVVAYDQASKTITFKDDQGQEHKAPVSGAALLVARSVKAGEKVSMSCHDNEKGEHMAIVGIKPARS
ncbi:MAG TPA: hypothetical protein VE404_03245 [Verrucomicrobiae bacterium]|nr:hypothetical protein [Verrucomicrobiae bacterium]